MKLTAQVTIEYSTQQQLDSIKSKIPPGVNYVVDALLKKVSFTIIQNIESL